MQFSDFLDQSGYTDFVESAPVPPHYVVFGYKQGICVYTGDSKHEAEQAGATVTERVLNPEYIPYQNQKVLLRCAAVTLWQEALFKEHSDLPLAVLNIIYNRAYDASHHEGYDQTASEFSDGCDYVREILGAMTKT